MSVERTYQIKDAEGKNVRKVKRMGDLAPRLETGQTAVLISDEKVRDAKGAVVETDTEAAKTAALPQQPPAKPSR